MVRLTFAVAAPLIRQIVREHLGVASGELELLAGGEISIAVGVKVADSAYVVRLSSEPTAADGFALDQFAARTFDSVAVPIPAVLALGTLAGYPYALSRRAIGVRLEELTPAARSVVIPALLETVKAVGAITPPGQGYGAWRPDGTGRAVSWQAQLAAIANDHHAGYYQHWHRLFTTSFLDHACFQAVYQRMLALAAFCPELRQVVHGDLHFDNILTNGTQITGVIDWANALYGDALYDVAWLGRPNAWGPPLVAPDLLQAHFGDTAYYQQRIACYTCYLGLDDLRFYARNGRHEPYLAITAHLRELLAQTAVLVPA